MTVPFPPDPDEMNDQRAEWAQIAVSSFARQTGQNPVTDGWEEILADMISDLIHFADRKGIAYGEVHRRAMLMYAQETQAPLPFVLVDMAPVPDFQPGQELPVIGEYPTEEAAWLTLQELPDADTGRFRIRVDP